MAILEWLSDSFLCLEPRYGHLHISLRYKSFFAMKIHLSIMYARPSGSSAGPHHSKCLFRVYFSSDDWYWTLHSFRRHLQATPVCKQSKLLWHVCGKVAWKWWHYIDSVVHDLLFQYNKNQQTIVYPHYLFKHLCMNIYGLHEIHIYFSLFLQKSTRRNLHFFTIQIIKPK